jgi:nucleotide-binding universal stress UspA family protein
MNNIIIPTDFTDNAWKAACYAAQLFHEHPVKYFLINNFSAPYSHIEEGMVPDLQPMRDESESQLKSFLEKFKDLDHHDATTFEASCNFGPVYATIASIEEEALASTCVVMGTKGANSLSDYLLGTTAAGVIKNIKSPVIAVPNSAELKIPSEIALAIDAQGVDNLHEVRPLVDIAKLHHSKVSIINIHKAETELVLSDDAPEQYIIDHYLEGIEHEYRTIDGEYVEDKILDFAHQNDMDMLAIIHRDRGFWGNLFHNSLSKRLAYHSDIPLLVLNDQ